jgi:hypothetical protein
LALLINIFSVIKIDVIKKKKLKMCGRTASNLVANDYEDIVSKKIDKRIKEWRNKEDYQAKYNCCPTNNL